MATTSPFVTWLESLSSAGAVTPASDLLYLDQGGVSKKITPNSLIFGRANTWSAVQTFSDGNLALSGSTSGTSTLKAAAVAGTTTFTLPGTTGTLAILGLAQTWSATQSIATGANAVLYNTADQTTNTELATLGWTSNVFQISTSKAGTGTNRVLRLRSATTLTLESDGGAFTGSVVANCSFLQLNGAVLFQSNGSGVLTLYDGAGADFGRLTFGGTSASFGALARDGAGVRVIAANGTTGAFLSGVEQTAPAAPAANGYRIFAQDNGAGKTQLMVIFGSGAAQQIAIEP